MGNVQTVNFLTGITVKDKIYDSEEREYLKQIAVRIVICVFLKKGIAVCK